MTFVVSVGLIFSGIVVVPVTSALPVLPHFFGSSLYNDGQDDPLCCMKNILENVFVCVFIFEKKHFKHFWYFVEGLTQTRLSLWLC